MAAKRQAGTAHSKGSHTDEVLNVARMRKKMPIHISASMAAPRAG